MRRKLTVKSLPSQHMTEDFEEVLKVLRKLPGDMDDEPEGPTFESRSHSAVFIIMAVLLVTASVAPALLTAGAFLIQKGYLTKLETTDQAYRQLRSVLGEVTKEKLHTELFLINKTTLLDKDVEATHMVRQYVHTTRAVMATLPWLPGYCSDFRQFRTPRKFVDYLNQIRFDPSNHRTRGHLITMTSYAEITAHLSDCLAHGHNRELDELVLPRDVVLLKLEQAYLKLVMYQTYCDALTHDSPVYLSENPHLVQASLTYAQEASGLVNSVVKVYRMNVGASGNLKLNVSEMVAHFSNSSGVANDYSFISRRIIHNERADTFYGHDSNSNHSGGHDSQAGNDQDFHLCHGKCNENDTLSSQDNHYDEGLDASVGNNMRLFYISANDGSNDSTVRYGSRSVFNMDYITTFRNKNVSDYEIHSDIISSLHTFNELFDVSNLSASDTQSYSALPCPRNISEMVEAMETLDFAIILVKNELKEITGQLEKDRAFLAYLSLAVSSFLMCLALPMFICLKCKASRHLKRLIKSERLSLEKFTLQSDLLSDVYHQIVPKCLVPTIIDHHHGEHARKLLNGRWNRQHPSSPPPFSPAQKEASTYLRDVCVLSVTIPELQVVLDSANITDFFKILTQLCCMLGERVQLYKVFVIDQSNFSLTVGAGSHSSNVTLSVMEICNLALDLLSSCCDVEIVFTFDHKIRPLIGIHTGDPEDPFNHCISLTGPCTGFVPCTRQVRSRIVGNVIPVAIKHRNMAFANSILLSARTANLIEPLCLYELVHREQQPEAQDPRLLDGSAFLVGRADSINDHNTCLNTAGENRGFDSDVFYIPSEVPGL